MSAHNGAQAQAVHALKDFNAVIMPDWHDKDRHALYNSADDVGKHGKKNRVEGSKPCVVLSWSELGWGVESMVKTFPALCSQMQQLRKKKKPTLEYEQEGMEVVTINCQA